MMDRLKDSKKTPIYQFQIFVTGIFLKPSMKVF